MRPRHLDARHLLPALALLAWAQAAASQPATPVTEMAFPLEAAAAAAKTGVPEAAAPAGSGCEVVALGSPQVLFADDFESGDTSVWLSGVATRFSAQRIMDLKLGVRLDDDVTDDGLLRLDLETPKGHLYQRLTVPFSTAPAARRKRRVSDHPRPLAVQILTPTHKAEGQPPVTFSLPVAGTPIVHSSLYGEWRARAYLDASTTPCSDDLAFVLTQ